MATKGFTLKITGDVKKFQAFTSTKTMNVIGDEIKKATAKSVAMVLDKIEQGIKQKQFKSNSPLTQAIKGEDYPLKDTGDLLQILEYELKGQWEAFVGILRKGKTSHGGDLYRVVQLLEEGFEVRITPEMRKALFAKAGGNIASGGTSSSAGVLRIPPRPFLRSVFESKSVHNEIFRNWEQGIQKALRRMGAL